MKKAFSLVALAVLALGSVSAQIIAAAGQGAVVATKTTAASTLPDESSGRVVDENGVPVCTAKWPMIKDVQLSSLASCSEACEKALYFAEYYDYQKCHSCCGERFQAAAFANRGKTDCPVVEGAECAGKGKCTPAGTCACNPAWGGPACQEKRDFAYCHAVGDPHWRTFDGLYFNVYSTGEFLQYFNAGDTENNEAVVNYNAPYYTVTVNKGIAVRRLDEIVTVGFPSGLQVDCVDALPKLVKGVMTTRTGLTVTVSGITTKISSPSGMEVTVETNGWGQNLWVRILGVADGQCLGLCGNFDGQLANDDGWPASRGRQEPIAAVVKAVTVPEDASFFKCRKAAYTTRFGTAALTMIDYESPEIKTFVANTQRVSPVTLRPELAAYLSPDLADRLKKVYEVKCIGDRRKASEDACWGLLNNGAVRAIVDCIEDQCETGNANFIASALQSAKEDLAVKSEIKNDKLNLEIKEFKAETGADIKLE
jgi:hypothetical protein